MKRLVVVACVAILVTTFASPLLVPGSRASATGPPQLERDLVLGASIHGANGLAIDHDGRLLVASVWGQEIVALDRSTGRVLERYGPTYGGVPIGGPDDVAVGPDGSIYWTDILGGRVGRIAPNGTATAQFVAPGMNPIAFNSDGRLFAAQAFFGDNLYELDPELIAPPELVIAGPGGEGFPLQLNGFDFGPDGKLYAPRPFAGQVVRIDVDAKALTVLPGFAGAFPASLEFDADGQLFSNLGTGPVVRLDPVSGAVLETLATLEGGLDNMVFDAKGRLFVSNSDTGAVDRIVPTGGVRTVLRGGLIAPGGIAVMPGSQRSDRLVVGDLWTIVSFNGRTSKFLGLESRFTAPPPVEGWTVAPDGPGRVIVTSWMSNAVQVWGLDGGGEIERHAEFGFPLNAIRFGTDLVVAVPGAVLREAPGSPPTPMAAPVGIPSGLAATNDDLWVADWATGNLWQLVADGVAGPILVTSGLAAPEGLAVDVDGALLVVEAGAGRLTRVDPTTGAKVTLATGLAVGGSPPPGAPPFFFIFNGVAVGSDGDIYVTGELDFAIYRFSRVP